MASKSSESEDRLGQINGALGDIEGQFAEIGSKYKSPFGDLKDLFLESGELRLEKLQGLFEEFGESGIPGIGNIIAGILGNILGDLLGDLFGDLFNLDNLIPNFLEDLLDDLHELVPVDILNIAEEIPGLPSYGDCFRNIDDILVENLQRKMNNFAFKLPVGMGGSNLMPITFDFVKTVESKIETIVDAAPMSIMDIIAGIQSAPDLLTKTKYIAKLAIAISNLSPEKLKCLNEKLYPADAASEGGNGGGLTDLLGKLVSGAESLDPCALANGGGIPGLPIPGCIPPGPPRPFPTTIPPNAPNTAQIALNEEASDIRYRLGEAMSIESMAAEWGNTGDHMAANTTLQLLVRGMHNAIAAGQSPDSARATFDANVERILKEKERSAEWFKREDGVIDTSDEDSPYEYFKALAPGLADMCMADAPIIAAHAGAQDLQTTNAYEAWQSVGHPENPPKAETC